MPLARIALGGPGNSLPGFRKKQEVLPHLKKGYQPQRLTQIAPSVMPPAFFLHNLAGQYRTLHLSIFLKVATSDIADYVISMGIEHAGREGLASLRPAGQGAAAVRAMRLMPSFLFIPSPRPAARASGCCGRSRSDPIF